MSEDLGRLRAPNYSTRSMKKRLEILDKRRNSITQEISYLETMKL